MLGCERGGKHNTWSARRGGNLSQRQRFMPRFTFSSVLLCFILLTGFMLYFTFCLAPLPGGETFYSPIYIGTDSFGINYKLHELGFEYGFSG